MSWLARILAFLSLLPALCAAQQGEWVTLPLGSAQDLVLQASGDYTARLPVRLAAGASALQVRLFAVASRQGPAASIAGAFHAVFHPRDATRDAAIEVTVPQSQRDLIAGPYTVSLLVSPDLADSKVAAQVLPLTLTVPVPQLQVDPLYVGIVEPLLGPPVVSGAPLRLREKGGRSAVRELSVATTPDAAPPRGGEAAVLAFDPVGDVRAGSQRTVAFAPSGFALGKSTGKLEIASRDLASPVVVAYEVRVHRSLAWLFWLVAAAAFLGWLVRVALARRHAKLIALAGASRAVAALNRAAAGSEDAVFRGEIEKLRTTLAEATSAGDAKAIGDAASAALVGLETARTQLSQRLQPLLQDVGVLRSLLDAAWYVPAEAKPQWDTVRQALEDVEARLAHHDEAGARKLSNARLANALGDFANRISDLGASLGRYLAKLAREGAPLRAADQEVLQHRADSVQKQFAAGVAGPTATIEEFRAALHAAWSELKPGLNLLDDLQPATQEFTRWTQAQLSMDAGRPELVQAAQESATQLDPATLRQGATGGSQGLGDLGRGLDRLRRAWTALLLPTVGSGDAEALQTALRSAHWEEAVVLAKKRLPATGTKLGSPGPATATAAAATPVTDGPSLQSAAANPWPQEQVPRLPAAVAPLVGSEAELASLQTESHLVAALQSALLAAIFLAGVLALYEDSWVGTGKEMLSLFLLAFSLDLTADSVVAALKKPIA